jgi:hypothetical protein
MAILRRLRTERRRWPCRGQKVSVFVFAFFTPAITPPFAAHWSDTEPTIGSEIKNRARDDFPNVPPLMGLECLLGWVFYKDIAPTALGFSSKFIPRSPSWAATAGIVRGTNAPKALSAAPRGIFRGAGYHGRRGLGPDADQFRRGRPSEGRLPAPSTAWFIIDSCQAPGKTDAMNRNSPGLMK